MSTALLSLAACSGGSSGSGGAPGGGPQGAQGFSQQELEDSTGLEQIGAAEGYAQITGAEGGQGVTIAIIDDGIDETHPEIAPNLVASFLIDDAQNGPGEHGTAVASIAAGAGNNGGIMGVAYDAGIVAYQAGDVDPSDPSEIVLDSNSVAISIEAAAGGEPDGEADILNLSLGFSFSGPLLLRDGEIVDPTPNAGSRVIEGAMRTAAGNGKLIVVAAGNDFNNRADVEDSLGLPRGSIVDIGAEFPAQSAREPDLDNSMIVVMAVDENNQRAFFSNSCLGVEDRCLAAPGTDFRVAEAGGGISDPVVNGTSFATPMVSGAAAVVQGAFPGTTPREAGNRLLSTATDLGTTGTDSTFGRGLLNLENALSPQGRLSVATSNRLDGPKAPLAGSGLALGSALALDAAGASLLGEVVVLDADNFPFAVDLSGSAAVQSRETGLEAFVTGPERRTSALSTGLLDLALAFDEDERQADPYRAEFLPSDTALRPRTEAPSLRLRSAVNADVDLFFAFNGASGTEAGLVASLPAAGDLFQPAAFLAPFDQLAGPQTGGGTRVALDERTNLAVSAFASTAGDDASARRAVLQKVELAHRMAGDVELRLGYGFMQEERGFLGSTASGAFGETSGRSQYFDLSILAPLSDRLSLFGAYSLGRTAADGGVSSLVSDYSRLRSEAFGVGVSLSDVVAAGDGLSLMVGQPLRVTEGTAELTVPVGRTKTGDVLQASSRLDLAPDGREIVIEAVYRLALGDDQSLATGSFLRLNPDHDPDAAPDIGVGFKYQIRF